MAKSKSTKGQTTIFITHT